MSMTSRIRHSFLGKTVRNANHLMFRARHPSAGPITYRPCKGSVIRLYPEGEIAEFLAFPWMFERAEIALVSAFLRPGMKMIDVGANVGLYSIVAAHRVGESGSVWAFEPSRESVARLERNLILNGCGAVRVCRIALSDTPNTLLPLTGDPGFGDAYRYIRPTTDSKYLCGEEVVAATTLDAWAGENRVVRADFLKVDIEGGEYRMLLGAQHFLRSNQQIVIMFECEVDWCTRAGCCPQDVCDLLSSLGFGIYAWNHRLHRWSEDTKSLSASSMLWATRNRAVLPIV